MKIKTAFFFLSFGFMAANFATVFAQPVEIDVTGGGFNIAGPSQLVFAQQPFSFNNQTSVVNFKDVTNNDSTTQPPPYLDITDENGGSAFSVALGAEDLTPQGSGICNAGNCIPKGNLAIRNNDGSSPQITTVQGSSSDASLDASTNFSNNPPATLDQQRILLNGTGAAPGEWRIYPQLQETTPGNTAIGNYSGSIIITIMTN